MVSLPLWLFICMVFALPAAGFVLCGLLSVASIEVRACDPGRMGECKDVARYFYRLGRKRRAGSVARRG